MPDVRLFQGATPQNDVILRANYSFQFGSGVYVLTGNPIGLAHGYTMNFQSGVYRLTMYPATFVYKKTHVIAVLVSDRMSNGKALISDFLDPNIQDKAQVTDTIGG